MRANFPLFWCIVLFMCVGSNAHGVQADTISRGTVSAARVEQPQWKSTPEDTGAWRREPFKSTENQRATPLTSIKSIQPATTFVLHGIMKSNSHFYAIINGTTVRAGNRIDGWNVAEINRYRVTLRRDKETQLIDIFQGIIDRGTR